jgi:ribokinase
MADIVVVGSLNMDLVVTVPHLPQAGETIAGGELLTTPGGKGANQAVAAAKLGARVAMVGCVGRDPFGARLLSGLEAEGIDITHLRMTDESATGSAIICVDVQGNNSIVISAGANGKMNEADVSNAEELIANAGMVLLQLEIPLEIVSKVIDIAFRYHTPILLNTAPAAVLAADILAKVKYLVANEIEVSLLAGQNVTDIASARRAAQSLWPLGPTAVVVTMGEKGAVLASGAGIEHIPACKVNVVDTTASGDAFIGGFAAALVRGFPLKKAAAYAVCAGSLAATKLGAQSSLPTDADIHSFLRERGGEGV